MMISHQLKSPSYRNASYSKAATAYSILENILGEEVFKQTLKEYISRWNGKHPTPYDFFNTFNIASGENLDWFWKPWFFEFGYPDLGIQDVKLENGKIKITVKKIGNYPVSVSLTLITENGKEIYYEVSAEIWNVAKNNEFTYEKEINENIVSVKLGNKYIPDINPGNNEFLIK